MLVRRLRLPTIRWGQTIRARRTAMPDPTMVPPIAGTWHLTIRVHPIRVLVLIIRDRRTRIPGQTIRALPTRAPAPMTRGHQMRIPGQTIGGHPTRALAPMTRDHQTRIPGQTIGAPPTRALVPMTRGHQTRIPGQTTRVPPIRVPHPMTRDRRTKILDRPIRVRLMRASRIAMSRRSMMARTVTTIANRIRVTTNPTRRMIRVRRRTTRSILDEETFDLSAVMQTRTGSRR